MRPLGGDLVVRQSKLAMNLVVKQAGSPRCLRTFSLVCLSAFSLATSLGAVVGVPPAPVHDAPPLSVALVCSYSCWASQPRQTDPMSPFFWRWDAACAGTACEYRCPVHRIGQDTE